MEESRRQGAEDQDYEKQVETRKTIIKKRTNKRCKSLSLVLSH